MRKLILTSVLALTCIGFAAMAQTPVAGKKLQPDHSGLPLNLIPNNTQSSGKAIVSDWFDPTDWLDAFTNGGTSVSTFVDFLLSDSLPKFWADNDTTYRLQSISVGQVIDPTDDVIDLTNNPTIKFTKFSSYTMDSIFFNYLYVRNIDSVPDGLGGKLPVVDTLFIYYYKTNALGRGTFGTAPNTVAYASVPSGNYNMSTQTPTNFFRVQKVLLTSADSTSPVNNNGGFENSWRLRGKSIAIDTPLIAITPQVVGVNRYNYSGVTFKFKPGHSYDSSSVFVYQKNPATFTGKRCNYFGFRIAQNAQTATQWRSKTFYTHSLFADKENAYYTGGSINNGWSPFIPGNAYFAGRVMFAAMHFTSGNVGVKNPVDNSIVSTVYPNPAASNNIAYLGLTLDKSASIKATLVNIMGQEVKQIVNQNYASGEQVIDINLDGVKPGVYFVNININGVSQSRKLTVN